MLAGLRPPEARTEKVPRNKLDGCAAPAEVFAADGLNQSIAHAANRAFTCIALELAISACFRASPTHRLLPTGQQDRTMSPAQRCPRDLKK